MPLASRQRRRLLLHLLLPLSEGILGWFRGKLNWQHGVSLRQFFELSEQRKSYKGVLSKGEVSKACAFKKPRAKPLWRSNRSKLEAKLSPRQQNLRSENHTETTARLAWNQKIMIFFITIIIPMYLNHHHSRFLHQHHPQCPYRHFRYYCHCCDQNQNQKKSKLISPNARRW